MSWVGRFFTSIISVISGLATILVVWIQWAGKATVEGQIAIFVLSFFALGLGIALTWKEYRYARKVRYVEALPHLTRLFLEVQAFALKPRLSAEEIQHVGASVTTHLTHAFALITGTNCSACVKVIQGGSPSGSEKEIRPRTITMCRDALSEEARTRAKNAVIDWIDQNTDFEELHRYAGTPKGRAFFANHLPSMREYKNSSIEAYGTPLSINMPLIADFLRDRYWKLPYKSTIVVPITSRSEPNVQEQPLIGYLCLDSRSRYVFSRQYDIDLLVSVADCLSIVVDRYWAQAWRNEQEGEKR